MIRDSVIPIQIRGLERHRTLREYGEESIRLPTYLPLLPLILALVLDALTLYSRLSWVSLAKTLRTLAGC